MPNADTSAVTPFTVDVPQDVLDDLDARLRKTRLPVDFANDDWRYGVNGVYLREFLDYWLTGYDWRAHEAAMNRFNHFRTTMDGIPIHFIHERGVGPEPIPLILSHGWPWTFWDFKEVIGPLANPAAHGGDPADAFDIVVPSLPGYGFSSPLTTAGVSPRATADLWLRLMRDVLGYERFGAQGGDWGAIITAQMGHAFAEHLIGVHLSMPGLPGDVLNRLSADDYGPDEDGWFDRMRTRMRTATSHLALNSNDPQTAAYALNDSPAGLAAWIIERRRNFGDTNGDVESRFSKDDLITTTMIYWVTESFGTAMRFYWENAHDPWQPRHDRHPVVEAPTGIAVFPQELLLIPRAVAARETNLQHWTVMPSGGHYAPAEEPELFLEDVRTFFRALR